MVRHFAYITLFSILIFFSISFITVLTQIHSPFHRLAAYELRIGFPLTYYYQFPVQKTIIAGWNVQNLFWDCLITWISVTGVYFFFKKMR